MSIYPENLPLEEQEISQPLPAITAVTYIYDGNETTIEVRPDGKPLLDAALEAGIDAPYSCRAGVCATCRAKVMEGKVHMKNPHALTEEEIEQGYVLTCQSHPLTPTVVVDYDY